MEEPPSRSALLDGLTPGGFARLSGLLDELLEMAPSERDGRIAALERDDPGAGSLLRELFAAQEACHARGFLEARSGIAQRLIDPTGAGGSAAGGIPPDADSALAGRTFGPYRVLSLLGRGGMGSVWLAERADGLLRRRLALKLVHPALMSPLMAERLEREREILGGLTHPHIVPLLDAGRAPDGQPYLVLEYVEGVPLTTYCDDRRLSIRERLRLFRQVLSAVQYAHAHLVVHRDLKPSNVLVTADGQVRLLDFGIAKLVTEGAARDTELTQLGGRILTPDYAAPEQITGEPITTAADVYALGVMLYELLTGERPYRLKRASRGALEEAILREEPVPPSRTKLGETLALARGTSVKRLMRTLAGDLDTITLKALKKPPGERYPTANAFADDIDRFLRGDAVSAQRDSVLYRTRKFAWRHRLALGVAGALLLTLAGGLAATSYEAAVAAAQRDAALAADRRLLTQAAAARLRNGDAPGSLAILLEMLAHRRLQAPPDPDALGVFEEARAADAQALALIGHTDRVRAVAYSPDGRRLVTASYDGTARVWDAATGRELKVLSGHTDRVISAAFSPDGRLIATGSFDGTIRLWDAATGRTLSRLAGHGDRVRSVAFSPDGRLLVSASYDRTAHIWDVATGRQVRALKGHQALVTSASFSSDGRRIVTSSYDKTARVWDAATGRQIEVLSGHTDVVTSAAFSPDGRRIVTASGDKTARIWDAATGRQLVLLGGHTQLVAWAVFSADDRRVLTASYDETARIWDAVSGRQIRVLSGHTDFVEQAVFSPDGRHVATASSDGTARVWDAVPSGQLRELRGHTDSVATAAFSPDGRRIVTASFDKTARIWETATGRELAVLRGHTGPVACAAFSPDGTLVVTASLDGTARIWEAATGRSLRVLTGHVDRVVAAAFSPDGRRVITASLDKTARIWDAGSGREIMPLVGHTALVENAAFSPDGQRAATASDDETARVWDAFTGRQLLLLTGHTGQVVSAKFSADGRRILTASDDGTARIWDAATGRQIEVLGGHADRVTDAAFSPHGRRIVTASADRTVRIWDTATGRPIKVLSGHAELVDSAEFSPDGRYVVTASDDGTARLWDASAPPLDVQIEWAEAAQFDPLTSTERAALGLPAAIRPRAAQPRGEARDTAGAGALARLAARSEAAAYVEASPTAMRSRLLEAFKYYAEAADRARRANWPDAAWADWRHHRASLARCLARDGMMRQVAAAFDEVRTRDDASDRTLWRRLAASL